MNYCEYNPKLFLVTQFLISVNLINFSLEESILYVLIFPCVFTFSFVLL